MYFSRDPGLFFTFVVICFVFLLSAEPRQNLMLQLPELEALCGIKRAADFIFHLLCFPHKFRTSRHMPLLNIILLNADLWGDSEMFICEQFVSLLFRPYEILARIFLNVKFKDAIIYKYLL